MSETDDEIVIGGKSLPELRVVDLKDLLEQRGLSKSGSKNILIKRLKDAMVLEKQQQQCANVNAADSVPNMEMKSCGSNIVTKYLEEQQRALQVAKKAAQETRAAQEHARNSSSGSNDSGAVGQLKNGQQYPSENSQCVNNNNTDSVATSIAEKLPCPENEPDAATSNQDFCEETGEQVETQDFEQNQTVELVSAVVPVQEHRPVDPEGPVVDAISDVVEANQEETSAPDGTMDELEERKIVNEVGAEPSSTTPKKLEQQQNKLDSSKEKSEILQDNKIVQDEDLPINLIDEQQDKFPEGKDEPQSEERESSESQQEGSPKDDTQSDEDRPINDDNGVKSDVDLSPRSSDNKQTESDEEQPIEEDEEEKTPVRRIDRFSCEDESHELPMLPNVVEDPEEKLQEPAAEKPQKKRRWGSTAVGKKTTVSITSDSLQEIVGHVTVEKDQPIDPFATTPMDDQFQLDYDEEPLPKRIVVPREDSIDDEGVLDEQRSVRDSSPPKAVQLQSRRITEPIFDEGYRRDRPASPARRPCSRLLHVHGLTRPFPMKGLFHFLHRFGAFIEKDFWIDNIKSHCFVTYETKEMASDARDQMDNVLWPITNNSRIRADFATDDDLDRHRNRSSKENEKPVVHVAKLMVGRNGDDSSKMNERPVKDLTTIDLVKVKRTIEFSPKIASDDLRADSKYWPKSREWDRGKEEELRSRSPKRNRMQCSPPGERSSDRSAKEPSKPVLIEDLFRKTKTAPQLYWMPLTQEQIAERRKKKPSSSSNSYHKNKDDQKIEFLKKLAMGGDDDEYAAPLTTTSSNQYRRRAASPPPMRRSPGGDRYRTSDEGRRRYW